MTTPIKRKKTKKDELIALADAQLLGWRHARDGYSIESLCDSMGLTAREWAVLNKKYDMGYLREEDRYAIEEYLKTI